MINDAIASVVEMSVLIHEVDKGGVVKGVGGSGSVKSGNGGTFVGTDSTDRGEAIAGAEIGEVGGGIFGKNGGEKIGEVGGTKISENRENLVENRTKESIARR